ncbi:hypothetical protein QBC42DRAFT_228846 [Cladorrhinum samala]|uniref:Uncharacterized protein n=1 Tax=Cladorrhinum samala TaxID=585594 RepID=A0AAV9HKY7_9PEZI|nr:hypothetical protein QBC42DRAFT_228846 [Cladorrhinum samala]
MLRNLSSITTQRTTSKTLLRPKQNLGAKVISAFPAGSHLWSESQRCSSGSSSSRGFHSSAQSLLADFNDKPTTTTRISAEGSSKETATSASSSSSSSSLAKPRRKTQKEIDEELKQKMEGISGDGGASGVEYEDGQPTAMKRSVRNNMFRYI